MSDPTDTTTPTETARPRLTAVKWLIALLLVAVVLSTVVSVMNAASQQEALDANTAAIQEVREAVEANTAAMREIEQGRRQPTVLHSYGDECDDLGGSRVYVPFQSLRACDAGTLSSFSIPHDRDWNDEFSEAYNWSPSDR